MINISGLCSHTQKFLEISRLCAGCDKTRATHAVHLRLIGKRLVDFLLVIIKLFSLGVTVEALRPNVDWKSALSLQTGQSDPKFQVEGIVPHQPFLLSEN